MIPNFSLDGIHLQISDLRNAVESNHVQSSNIQTALSEQSQSRQFTDSGHSDAIISLQSHVGNLEQTINAQAAAMKEFQETLKLLSESKKDGATSGQVQEIRTDLLLLWNSIKQMDSTKVDERRVETIVTEGARKFTENIRSEVSRENV